MGQFSHQSPSIEISQFWLQLSIGVLIVSQHVQYVDHAVGAALSPPIAKFLIVPIFVESRKMTRQFRIKYLVTSQQLKEYWSYRKSESWR
jgi:hypothetical protein